MIWERKTDAFIQPVTALFSNLYVRLILVMCTKTAKRLEGNRSRISVRSLK